MRAHQSRAEDFSAIGVTRQTVGRVVRISALLAVFLVRFRPRVAGGRAGENGIAAGGGVALRALGVSVGAPVDREPHVIEHALVPRAIACPVADLAVGGEARRPVIGISGGVEVIEVAVDAVRRQTLVDAARVAGVALEAGVGADERVGGVGEGGALPGGVGASMAGLAVGREARRPVVGILVEL